MVKKNENHEKARKGTKKRKIFLVIFSEISWLKNENHEKARKGTKKRKIFFSVF